MGWGGQVWNNAGAHSRPACSAPSSLQSPWAVSTARAAAQAVLWGTARQAERAAPTPPRTVHWVPGMPHAPPFLELPLSSSLFELKSWSYQFCADLQTPLTQLCHPKPSARPRPPEVTPGYVLTCTLPPNTAHTPGGAGFWLLLCVEQARRGHTALVQDGHNIRRRGPPRTGNNLEKRAALSGTGADPVVGISLHITQRNHRSHGTQSSLGNPQVS